MADIAKTSDPEWEKVPFDGIKIIFTDYKRVNKVLRPAIDHH